MSWEKSDGSSDSTDPPSLASLAAQPKTLAPLYVHRKPPPPLVVNGSLGKPTSSVRTPSPTKTDPALRSHRSNLYALATSRSRQVFVDVRKASTAPQPQTFPHSNPMAVHLARRQAQAARIMAGEDSENTLLFRPCRIDLKYKSPRRLRQIFRRRSSQSPWTSQYIGDIYYPVEVAQEFSRWRVSTPQNIATSQGGGLPPLIAMDSPQRAHDPESCCGRWPFPALNSTAKIEDTTAAAQSPSFITGVSSSRFRNKGFTDSELAWAMNRTCRVRKPWATIIEKERASRGELRYAGIKLLAGLLEARAGWPLSPGQKSTGELSAAIRSLCYEDDNSRLDYIKRRKNNETCAPDWVLQLMMPMIAPLTPRRGYTLLSETLTKAQAHFNTLSEAALMEIQNNMGHLNLNQLSHLRLALPEKGYDGSLRKVRVRDLISTCEQLIGQRFWIFLSERVRPSSAIYEALLTRATDALFSHTVLPHPSDLVPRKTSKVISDWSSTVSSTPSDRIESLDSLASLVGNNFRQRQQNSDDRAGEILSLPSARTSNFVELPKLRINVKQNLGLALLEVLGVLALSKETRAELLEEPVTTLSDQQSWWLVFTEDLTKSLKERPPSKRRVSAKISMDLQDPCIPLDVVDEEFQMCFLRLPALELRFVRPDDEDVFTINEMVKPEGLGGHSVWAIRAIPPEVEDLLSFAPVNPSAYLGGLCMDEAFKKRREAADAHAMTSANVQPLHKPRQRLRSVSRTRIIDQTPLIKTLQVSQRASSKMLRRAPTTMHDWLTQTTPQRGVGEIDVYGTSPV